MSTEDPSMLIAQLATSPAKDHLPLAHALVAALETPRDTLQRIAWAEPARYAALRAAVDLRLFERLAGAPGASAAALGGMCGADGVLLARLLSHLAAVHVVREVGRDGYENGPLGAALVEPRFRDGVVYNFDVALPAQMALPAFLRETAYADPVDPVKGPFQASHATDAHFFGWVGARPQYLAAFGNWMAGYSAGRMNWGGYPAATALAGVPEGDVLLVDVGGGQGHDLAEFRAAFPTLGGKLVLQDKADVVAAAAETLPPGATAMAHDFFGPQSVRGARAYHLHSVLHDWPADECVRILAALKPALGVESRVLINELVVPPRAADWRVTGMDLLMMVLGSVRERTEAEWREIVVRAGLRVVRVWYGDAGRESLIEVALPE